MLNRQQVLDRYFPEVRAWLIQIAAVMDRADRAEGATPASGGDQREALYAESLKVLADTNAPDRAERILRLFSDPVD
ncbi:hypothetical protein HED60_03090 [Planctomycetales bacterium ZRK34]|nr:hypothetical protein HED60_03090 [Planctomycetales bacterium ZRK34]